MTSRVSKMAYAMMRYGHSRGQQPSGATRESSQSYYITPSERQVLNSRRWVKCRGQIWPPGDFFSQLIPDDTLARLPCPRSVQNLASWQALPILFRQPSSAAELMPPSEPEKQRVGIDK